MVANFSTDIARRVSKDKIFFYCFPQGPPEKAAYQHEIVCLAEGLKSLGIEFYSNVNYWQVSPENKQCLFVHNPRITPDDCSIVVLNSAWFGYGKTFPEDLFHPSRNYITVYLDRSDGNRTYSWNPEFRQFDLIFKTHYNGQCLYPTNLHPWGFGLSERILRETHFLPTFQERKRCLLFNFRVNHHLRKFARQELSIHNIQNVLPIDDFVDSFAAFPSDTYHYLQWTQTGRRHYPGYYERLKKSAACACFGGMFITSWPRNQVTPMSHALSRILNKLRLKSTRILQWDSWRFWESLASECATFHVDFEKYGLLLPVMPQNWRHYVGVDLDNVQAAVDRIADQPEILENISAEGRLWALKHYSPVPTALRFLETIHQQLC